LFAAWPTVIGAILGHLTSSETLAQHPSNAKRNADMSKIISASDAAALIKDGATVGAAACAMSGWPEEIAIGMEKQFLATGHPAKLTIVHAAGIGDWKSKGTQHFAHDGMVARWIGGHCGAASARDITCRRG
jgi:propionate CoA-transferase